MQKKGTLRKRKEAQVLILSDVWLCFLWFRCITSIIMDIMDRNWKDGTCFL